MPTHPLETVQAPSGGAGDKGLKKGAIGLVGSIVVGMASTAPAYSLAASLGLVVAAGAGLKAPAIMLLAFLPMYFIAVAYRELNEAEPDCGTTFTWATRAFGPVAGWMGGWGIIVADVIVMANLAQIAGTYSFQLADELGLHNDLASSTLWSTAAGLLWIAIMTYICYRGIELSARLQVALLSIEIATLLVFVVTALYRVFSGTAGDQAVMPSLSWLWPSNLSFTDVLAPAVLTAVFIYWGWDTAVSTNEETKDPGRTPGRAAVISTLLLLLTYVLVSVAAVSFAGVGTDGIGLGNADNAADVFNAIGPALYGDSLLGKVGLVLLSVTILSSSAASTQTTILPTARTALSMAAYKAIPTRFATIHPRFLTPAWSTIGMGVVSMAFFLLMTWISPSILLALIGAIGLQIAFYYGLTGIACAWFFRKTLTSSPRHFFMRGLIPLLGGVSLFVMFIYAVQIYAGPDNLTDADGNNVTIFGIGAVAVVGIGSLLLGLILMGIQWGVAPAFFQGKTLRRASHGDLLLEGEQLAPLATVLPDSYEALVIAPDLSNLPTGARAVDPESGEIFAPPPPAESTEPDDGKAL